MQIYGNTEEKIAFLPTYNNQHSIIPINKEIYDMIINIKEPYAIDKLVDIISIESNRLTEWEELLNEKKQIIFYGPPGTGKTFIAREFSKYLVSKHGGNYKIVQFHPSYSYEDFVEGLRPKTNGNGNITYEINDGLFKQFCNDASKDPLSKYIIIIDEINRGNLPKIFGELLFGLEYRNSENNVMLPYSKIEFRIPDNLWIIGTMNSADRSIALVDYALRRRFYFIELLPNESILRKFLEKHVPKDTSIDSIIALFAKINKSIDEENLGKHYQLGHSYFMTKEIDKRKIKILWDYSIKPILEEYCPEDDIQIANLEEEVYIITGIPKPISEKKD